MRGVVFWKRLYRSWCFVVYSGSPQRELGLKNFCKYSCRENPRSKRCLRAVTYLYQMWHVRRERAGINFSLLPPRRFKIHVNMILFLALLSPSITFTTDKAVAVGSRFGFWLSIPSSFRRLNRGRLGYKMSLSALGGQLHILQLSVTTW